MPWAQLILVAFRVIEILADYARNRQQISAGMAMQIANSAKEQHEAIRQALAARRNVNNDDDDSMLDDPYNRDRH